MTNITRLASPVAWPCLMFMDEKPDCCLWGQ